MLKRNVGRWDRVARLAVALAAFYPIFMDPGLIGGQIALGLVLLFGLINIVACVTGYCPVYHLSRFSTYRAAAGPGH